MEDFNKDDLVKSVDIKQLEGFIPDTRAYAILEVLEEDEILIHGGTNKTKDYSQIDVFDAESLKWRLAGEVSTVDPFLIFDKCLAGHTSNLIKTGINHKEKSIAVYGGFDGKSYSNAIYIIETDNYQFTQVDIRGGKVSEYPLPRCYHTANYEDASNCLLVYGGWNGNVSSLHNQNFFSLWKFCFNRKFSII